MIFKGISKSEALWFKAEDSGAMYAIIMGRSSSEADTFAVTCSHNDGWHYTFKTMDSSDYERVKWMIMDTLTKCDKDGNGYVSEVNLLTALGHMFEDAFEFILDIHTK